MSKKPDFIAYHVPEKRDGQDKVYWQRIGAAWSHDDGEGFNLQLDYMPTNGGRIVIRTRKEQVPTESTDAGE